jgi:hypothetical protein
MKLQCRVRNLASYVRPAARLAVLCRPALIEAAPSAYVQGKSVTLSARRGGEEG